MHSATKAIVIDLSIISVVMLGVTGAVLYKAQEKYNQPYTALHLQVLGQVCSHNSGLKEVKRNTWFPNRFEIVCNDSAHFHDVTMTWKEPTELPLIRENKTSDAVSLSKVSNAPTKLHKGK